MKEPELLPLVREVLERGYLLSLATQDEGGVWVADVIYVHDDGQIIYWMSDPASRHSRAIAANPHVAGAITASGRGEDNLGIQFVGVAEKIDGPRHDLAVRHFSKRGKPTPSASEDVLEGDSWYAVRATRIDLIHEKHFGFEKQTLTV